MTLTGEDEHTLLRAVQGVLDAGYRHVVLNLASVSYLDSTGVGEIVGAFTRVAREGGHLKLCGVSARTDELLRAANIDSVVPSVRQRAGRPGVVLSPASPRRRRRNPRPRRERKKTKAPFPPSLRRVAARGERRRPRDQDGRTAARVRVARVRERPDVHRQRQRHLRNAAEEAGGDRADDRSRPAEGVQVSDSDVRALDGGDGCRRGKVPFAAGELSDAVSMSRSTSGR